MPGKLVVPNRSLEPLVFTPRSQPSTLRFKIGGHGFLGTQTQPSSPEWLRLAFLFGVPLAKRRPSKRIQDIAIYTLEIGKQTWILEITNLYIDPSPIRNGDVQYPCLITRWYPIVIPSHRSWPLAGTNCQDPCDSLSTPRCKPVARGVWLCVALSALLNVGLFPNSVS